MLIPPLHAWPWPAPVRARAAAGGLINQTWWVHDDTGPVAVVQRLNTDIFVPEVHEDIHAITTHLARKGIPTPQLIRTATGALYTTTDDGVFRALTLIGDRTEDTVRDLAMAQSAAKLVAQVHVAVADLDWQFRSVRPGAHDTPTHHQRLLATVAQHPEHRLASKVQLLAKDLDARWRAWDGPQQLPTRKVHGDLKFSNIRFQGARAVGLIDLDTWQDGQLDAELGDAMRSWCNRAGEDQAEARVDVAVFESAMRGYHQGDAGLTTLEEWQGMAPGLERIALELSMRFAADALNESYFGFDPAIGRGEHNLLRAKGQLALATAAHNQRHELDDVVRRVRKM